MSEEVYEQQSSCSSDCSSCESSCSERKPSKEDFLAPMNQYSRVKKVIGVVSGKGGVGKSFVTSYLCVLMNRKGYKTAVLDADITGPSIPKAFGITKKAEANELGILPQITSNGIEIMSVNLLLDDVETPVVWRGPIIAGTVKQFWSDVVWGDVDYMFVDMPPGTGDVPLTVFQSLPVDGIVIVTSPQDLVSMIVAKAVNMATSMDIPVIGFVENYSYIECGNCGTRMSIFGKSHIEEISAKFGLPVLAKLPLNPSIAEAIDAGKVEELQGNYLDTVVALIEESFPVGLSKSEKRKIAVTTDENHNVFQHFGHCETFTVFDIEENSLVSTSTLTNSTSGHTATVQLLKDMGVNVLICGGIGSAAMSMLMEDDVLVIPGMQGDIDVAVASYLDGSSATSYEANCNHHHDHQDYHEHDASGEHGHNCHCHDTNLGHDCQDGCSCGCGEE
jgi:Mrp family chromosome partitioning ATPase/predicted Fe-Mo cluster-binding NifX family protein